MGGVAFWYWKGREDRLLEEPVLVLKRFQDERPLMGTMVSVILYAEDSETAQVSFEAAFERAAAINTVASDYLPDSELTRFNALEADTWFPASDDLLTMVAYGLELADLTAGAYDPTLGAMTHLWRETKAAGRLPTPETVQEVKSLSGWELMEVDLSARRMRKKVAGLRLDLGGLGKGYAADEMLEEVQAYGIRSALVLAGGDVRCGEAPPDKDGWTVGLKNYDGDVSAVISVANCAVSTSGDTQQFVEIEGRRYSHILDPATGLGMTDSLLATVIANNGLMADPLATAACVNPVFFRELSSSTDIHSRILSESDQQVSSGFPALIPLLRD